MKKLFSVLMVLCLCAGVLVGCGKSATETTKDTETEKIETETKETVKETEAETIKTQKRVSDFNSATNLKLSLKNITFEVPSNWKTGDKNTEELLYFYPGDGSMLMIMCTELNEPFSIENDFDGYIDTLSSDFDGFSLLGSRYDFVDGEAAVLFEYNWMYDNDEIHTTDTIFNVEDNGLMSISMAIPLNGVYDYSMDYTYIMNSVKFVESNSESEETQVVETEKKVAKTYKEGMYKIGSDMPAGEYVLFSSKGGYFEIDSDSTGSFESIITNDNFENNSIVTVSEGQYLKMTRCYAVSIDDNPVVDTTKEGMFKVGVHIDAGEYKITPTGSGYYEVATDSSHDFGSIVSNDNFDGDVYVTVSDGQYLKLNRAKIVQ